jgi:branched-chain amino acid aminotransferase group I|tara:strand:- start:179 stop:1039 length:861 start_codon:yes stop_codon:yes gene_type:complete
MSQIVYLNGHLIARNKAFIPAMDYGFLYGFGLFETMRAYKGKVFRLEHHLNRLAHSALILGLPIGALDLKNAVTDTIRANKLSEARIRITISIGEEGTSSDLKTCKKPTVLILADHYNSYSEKVYHKGYRAIISSIRRNSQSLLSRLKSTSYLESILARQEARSAGVDEALLLNENGTLAEASMSNIFLVIRGILKTPNEKSGILPGVTRQAILELAHELDIKAIEQEISLDELSQAEEAFLSNSLMEIIPLTEIDGKPTGTGIPGPLTQRLMAAYKKLVLSVTQT